jgi:hypothetical protein
MQQQGGASSGLTIAAKEFVPSGPPGLAGPGASGAAGLVKSSSTASLHKASSNSSLTLSALNAPVFVPGMCAFVLQLVPGSSYCL